MKQYTLTQLTSMTLPTGTKAINAWMFAGCPFTSVTIPSSVTFIGDSSFKRCYELIQLVIPDSVIYIDVEAFASDPFTCIFWNPNKVRSIGAGALPTTSACGTIDYHYTITITITITTITITTTN